MSSSLANAVARAQQNHTIKLFYSMPDPIMPVLTADSRNQPHLGKEGPLLTDMIAEHPKLFGCNTGAGLVFNVRRMQTEFAPQYGSHRDHAATHGLPSARAAHDERTALANLFQAKMDALRTPERFMEQSQRARLIMGDGYIPPLSIDMPPSEMLAEGNVICSSLQEFAESTNDGILKAAANETQAALNGIMASLQTALSPVITFGGDRQNASAMFFFSDAKQNARLVIQPERYQKVRDITLTSRSTYVVDCAPMVCLQLQGKADAFLIHSASLQVESSESIADCGQVQKKESLSPHKLRDPLDTTEGTGVREYEYYMNGLLHVRQIEFLASREMRAKAHITLPPLEYAVLAVHMSGGLVQAESMGIREQNPLVLLPKSNGKGHKLRASDPASIMLIGPLAR